MLIARRGGFPGGVAAGHGCRYRIELESFFFGGVSWRWELSGEEGLG